MTKAVELHRYADPFLSIILSYSYSLAPTQVILEYSHIMLFLAAGLFVIGKKETISVTSYYFFFHNLLGGDGLMLDDFTTS